MNAAFAATSGAAIPESPAPETPIASLGMGYFEQIMPEPPRICGLALKPLSIGRYRRMKRQNVRFVSEEAVEISENDLVGDLLKAVLICSMTCADYDAFIADPASAKEVKRWAQQVGFLPERYYDWGILGKWFVKYIVGERVTQIRNERAAAYLLAEMRKFQEYIIAGQVAPGWMDEATEGRASVVHWSHSIEGVLREKQGWSKEEIDEEPLTKALWDYFKSMENMGLGYILSESEAEELSRKLTPEEEAQSAATLKALWEYKFPGVPMPSEESSPTQNSGLKPQD
jgi:hypothetical protein